MMYDWLYMCSDGRPGQESHWYTRQRWPCSPCSPCLRRSRCSWLIENADGMEKFNTLEMLIMTAMGKLNEESDASIQSEVDKRIQDTTPDSSARSRGWGRCAWISGSCGRRPTTRASQEMERRWPSCCASSSPKSTWRQGGGTRERTSGRGQALAAAFVLAA